MIARFPESAFRLAILLLYVVILVFVSFHHERWRDEAEAWLFARDADYVTMVTRAGYSGHMAPWFLLLSPFAKGGAPYATIAVLNGIFATAAVAIFLWFAPFGRAIRGLFAISYYPLYEYGVIARMYGLTMLVLFVIAYLFPTRHERPLRYALAIFLLSNLNVQGLFIACALILGHLVELSRRRTHWRSAAPSLLVMGAGVLQAWLQLRTPADGAIAGFARIFVPGEVPQGIAGAFFPFAGGAGMLAAAAGAAILVLVAIQIGRDPVPAAVLWLSLASFIYLWVFKWPGSPRHHGFILLVVLLVLWLSRGGRPEPSRNPLPGILLIGALTWSAAVGLHRGYLDVIHPFSGAKGVADFLRAEDLESLPIAAHSAPRAAAILPYLSGQKRLWFAGIGEFGSYLMWDQEFNRGQEMAYPEAVERAVREFEGRDWLLLLDAEMPEPERRGFRLLHRSPEKIVGYPDETFFLYGRSGNR